MGASYLKNLFKQGNKKHPSTPRLEVEQLKKEVAQLQKKIKEKIKDPKEAKKAALIIEQMLNKDSQKPNSPKKPHSKAS